MKLSSKKNLASKTLGIGKGRAWFNPERLEDIKAALTKQDIRDLFKDGAIKIKTVKGKKTRKIRKTRRRRGSIGKKVSTKKRDYVNRIRKIRALLKSLKSSGKINSKEYSAFNRYARSVPFRDIKQFKEYLNEKLKARKQA